MFTPNIVVGREVVYASQVLELINGCLLFGNSKLVLKFAGRRNPNTELVRLDLLFLEVVERMRATCVRPHVWKSDLFGRALLQQEPSIGRPEHERREGAVQQALVDIFHQVTYACVVEVSRGHDRAHSNSVHVFLSAAPNARSSSSTRMHLSSINLDCSGSYLDRSMVERTAREARTAGDDMLRDKQGMRGRAKERKETLKRRTRGGLIQAEAKDGPTQHSVSNGSVHLQMGANSNIRGFANARCPTGHSIVAHLASDDRKTNAHRFLSPPSDATGNKDSILNLRIEEQEIQRTTSVKHIGIHGRLHASISFDSDFHRTIRYFLLDREKVFCG